jgi:acetylornithine/succinyldiaminopimelate/putrescine aminotransferase/predicted amino acid dehydrogenase
MESKKDILLKFFSLNKSYFKGEKDELYYSNSESKPVKVLDLVGSYGINILGYNHSKIISLMQNPNSFPPFFVQGSSNQEKLNLQNKLNELLSLNTNKTKWFCEFASTGTEIIEVSMKLLILNYQNIKDKVIQDINFSVNYLMLKGHHTLAQQITTQSSLINQTSYWIHFENSFHGKSAGALSLMGNKTLKGDFPVHNQVITLSKHPTNLVSTLLDKTIKYQVVDTKTGELIYKTFYPFIGLFLEAIQGEAGVQVLSDELIQEVAKFKKISGVPVVADEIQCGLYRTGEFLALNPNHLVADIYCFGKALGGGVAKISALCCSKDVYNSYFFQYHSSSFGEDWFSCKIANEVLNILANSQKEIYSVKSNWLFEKLVAFSKIHPKYIKAIRGKGNMLALEFNESAVNNSFISKYLKDLNQLGYWISSVLLNKENIRIFPTLSNPLSFRVQPSLYFTDQQLTIFLDALSRFFEALSEEDNSYLFGHIFPVEPNKYTKSLPLDLYQENFPEEAAVFICHPIDSEHICKIVDLIDSLPETELNEILDEVSDVQDFTVYHVDKLKNRFGEEIPIVYLGVPLTSNSFYHALRSGKRSLWIKKIQKAVDWANKRNAKSIGLGQFTSIITGNGMLLKSSKAILTTGNSYTAKICIDAIKKVVTEQNKKLSSCSISFVGAGGNIVSVIAEILSSECRKINLVYHSNYQNSKETKQKLISFLQQWFLLPQFNHLKNSLNVDSEYLNDFLDEVLNHISNYLTVSQDINSVKLDDIVVVGTNDPKAILFSEHIKNNGIVVDLSVPSNADVSIQNREDVVYIKGGIAALPKYLNQEQQLTSVILPFGKGECFACMAETFALGFKNDNSTHKIGDLTPKMIYEVGEILDYQGFSLKRLKVENSI